MTDSKTSMGLVTMANEPAETTISVRGLREECPGKSGAVTALDSLDLDIPRGQFFMIVGPSGCGKTTLQRILAHLEDASPFELPRCRDDEGLLRVESSGICGTDVALMHRLPGTLGDGLQACVLPLANALDWVLGAACSGPERRSSCWGRGTTGSPPWPRPCTAEPVR